MKKLNIAVTALASSLLVFATACSQNSAVSVSANETQKNAASAVNSSIEFIKGDADGNGKIEVSDVTLIQKVLADLVDDKDGMITRRGDVDGNGLSITDATLIQRFLAGYNDGKGIGTASEVTTADASSAQTETKNNGEEPSTESLTTEKPTEKPASAETKPAATESKTQPETDDPFQDITRGENELPFDIL